MAALHAPNPLLDFEGSPFTSSADGCALARRRRRRGGPASARSASAAPTRTSCWRRRPPPSQTDVARGARTCCSFRPARPWRADAAANRLATHIAAGRDEDLGDVAHTLLVGRRAFAHRRAVAAGDVTDAARRLSGGEPARRAKGEAPDGPLDVVLTFPGGGAQYPGMAADLALGDSRFDAFRSVVAEAIEETHARSGIDLRPLLAAGPADDERSAALRNPSASLPAVFAVEVAIARQLLDWGIRPRALVGHSLGEYAAAHLSGVLTLPDAVELVVRRSEMMERVSHEGAMGTVGLSEAELLPLLGADVSLAVVNAADECVVSGRATAVDALLARLAADGVDTHRIPLAAAAHSHMLDPVLPEFAEVVRSVTLSTPTKPYISNLTGTWITPEQATDPDQWVRHLRGTVRFADGLATALATGPAAVIEVGPGRTLTSYAQRQEPRPAAAVATLRHVKDTTPDDVHLLGTLGQLWAVGVDADWGRLVTTPGRRRKVTLPTYPFERTKHWIEPGERPVAAAKADRAAPATSAPEAPVRRPLDQWASAPGWSPLPSLVAPTAGNGRWLVVADGADTVAPRLAGALAALGAEVEVIPSAMASVAAAGADNVVVIGAAAAPRSPEDALAVAQQRWLGTAVDVVRAVSERDRARVGLVTTGAWTLPGDAPGRAAEALALGAATVTRAEHPNVHTSAIDLAAEPTSDDIEAAAIELIAGDAPVVALRGGKRHAPAIEPTSFSPDATAAAITPKGTWLVTGGLGGVGTAIASHLTAVNGCNLVVTASSPLPVDVAAWRQTHGPSHPVTVRLDRLEGLRAHGADVRVEVCDVADPDAIRALFARLGADGVRVDGVVHTAGVLADRPIALLDESEVDAVIGAKARGALVLADELERHGGGTLVLTSSTSTILAAGGQTAYVAANSVLDAMAGQRGNVRVVTVQWGVWAGDGMAAAAAERVAAGITVGRSLDHPVLHEVAADRNGGIHVRGALSSGVWTIDQHRLADGTALLPGTGAIELLLAALEAAGEPKAGVSDVTLLAPLVVADGATVPVRVVIDSLDKPQRSIRLDAVPASDGIWRTYVEAGVAIDASTTVPSPLPIDGDEIAVRFPEPVVNLLAGPESQLKLGARWHVATDARRGESELLATVDPPPYSDGWRLDAAVTDLAVAAGVALLPADGLWVPATIEMAGVSATVAVPRFVHARVQRPASDDGDIAMVDLVVADAHGTALVHVEGLTLRRVHADAHFAHGALPPPASDDRKRLSGSLLALALDGGIRTDDGGEAFGRVLASGATRLVVSSIALEALAEPTVSESPLSTGDGDAASTLDFVIGQWEDLLGVDPIGADDDFFELGGHSLIAVRVGRRDPPPTGRAAPADRTHRVAHAGQAGGGHRRGTGRDRCRLGAGHDRGNDARRRGRGRQVADPRPLVPLRPAGTKRPFFIVHGAGGNVLNLQGLARSIPGDRPVWGLQAHGNDGTEPPDSTIEQMATRYLEAVRHLQPSGPYLLGGYSGGGIVALEMSRQAAASGDRVNLVVMFDTFRPGEPAPTNTQKLRNLAHNLKNYGTAGTVDWMKDVARNRLARLGVAEGQAPPENVGLYYEFQDTVLKYHYTSYPTDVFLLRAAPERPTLSFNYSWPEVTGNVREYHINGDHHTLFAKEHAGELAGLVGDALDAAD